MTTTERYIIIMVEVEGNTQSREGGRGTERNMRILVSRGWPAGYKYRYRYQYNYI